MTAEDKKHAIFRALVEEIVSGKFQIGSRLPTDRELAARFGTSRINVFRALEQLKQQGIIISRKRAGTVVVAMPDAGESQQLLNDSSRTVYCLRSGTPQFVHWDEETMSTLEKIFAAYMEEVCKRELTDIQIKRAIEKEPYWTVV